MTHKKCSRCPETREAEFRRGDSFCKACRRAYNAQRKRELRDGLSYDIWEGWQGQTLICSRHMQLTEAQARTKVENERRLGYFMEARRA